MTISRMPGEFHAKHWQAQQAVTTQEPGQHETTVEHLGDSRHRRSGRSALGQECLTYTSSGADLNYFALSLCDKTRKVFPGGRHCQ